MTKWNEFTTEQKSALANVMAAKCMTSAGVTDSSKSSAIATLIGYVIESFVNVRCIYDPGPNHDDDTFLNAVAGICYVGTPYIPSIVGIIRNSGTGSNVIPAYGRTTSSESLNKTGTEQVSIKPSASSTLDEKITVKVPDLRSASTGNVTASDVDAAEKFRFDGEAEKSLSVLLSRWVRRASVFEDL